LDGINLTEEIPEANMLRLPFKLVEVAVVAAQERIRAITFQVKLQHNYVLEFSHLTVIWASQMPGAHMFAKLTQSEPLITLRTVNLNFTKRPLVLHLLRRTLAEGTPIASFLNIML